MTIRYKADHKVTREVTKYVPCTGSDAPWVGTHHDFYYPSHWEPVPEKRWVPYKTLYLQDDERATVIDGTVRFEREA